MTIDNALLWQNGFAADDRHGEVAEAYARANAVRATAAGDAAQASLWQATGEALQTSQRSIVTGCAASVAD